MKLLLKRHPIRSSNWNQVRMKLSVLKKSVRTFATRHATLQKRWAEVFRKSDTKLITKHYRPHQPQLQPSSIHRLPISDPAHRLHDHSPTSVATIEMHMNLAT